MLPRRGGTLKQNNVYHPARMHRPTLTAAIGVLAVFKLIFGDWSFFFKENNLI